MATFETRKSGSGKVRHHVKIRIAGHPPVAATFDRLVDAKRWATTTEADIRRGRHIPRDMPLSEACARYESERLRDQAPGTVEKRKMQFKFWCARFGSTAIAKITPAMIAGARDELLAKGFGGSAVGSYLAALSCVFGAAVREWGVLELNPCSRVRKPSQPPGRVRFLDDDERQRLLDACRVSRHEDLFDIVTLALATGLRKMEIVDLTWRDVNVDAGTLTLEAGRTKTRRARTVPLSTQIVDMLRARRRDGIRVFSTHPRRLDYAFVDAREAAGIKGFCFHDLRHSAASALAASGATLHEISIVLGHSSVTMSQRYAHLCQDHVRGVVQRMNDKALGNGK